MDHDSRCSQTVRIRCHSYEKEKTILGTRLMSFCTGNIVDEVTVVRSFSVSQQSANVRHCLEVVYMYTVIFEYTYTSLFTDLGLFVHCDI